MQLILEDSRQQEAKHKIKHDYWRSVGVAWNRTALYSGDYTLPNNNSVCIDTKKDIQELIGDIQVRQMPKIDVLAEVYKICEANNLSDEIAEEIYHAIVDDDADRNAEQDINNIAYRNNVYEGVISDFQKLYVKRYGFFHRGLIRAKYSGIKLIILVDNLEGVTSIDDLFHWRNPRLNIWINSNEPIGWYKNGNIRYKKVQKYPNAMSGATLAKACITMQNKYGCEFQFCRPVDAGKRILEILNIKTED